MEGPGSEYRAPNPLSSTHLPFVPRSYRSANLTQLDIPRLLGGEYAKPRLGITRSLAGNAETSTWLRLKAMRPHTQMNYQSNLNCSKPNRQPHLQTRVPRPEVKGRRKARRGRGSDSTIRTEDSLQIEAMASSDVCAGQAQAEVHSKMYSDVYLPLDALATTYMAAYNSYQVRAEAHGYSIRRFRCDHYRGEYDIKNFRTILAGARTYEPCPPYAHHKNGVAERIIGVITEKARAMMTDAQAPIEFWGEAVKTANYLHRLTPTNGLIKRDDRDGYKAPYNTPYEMLHAYGKPKHDAEAQQQIQPEIEARLHGGEIRA